MLQETDGKTNKERKNRKRYLKYFEEGDIMNLHYSVRLLARSCRETSMRGINVVGSSLISWLMTVLTSIIKRALLQN